MPIYEYQCAKCQHELEAFQKMDDPVLTQCPQCQTAALSKKISAAGFQLKGQGWYQTDFKNPPQKQKSPEPEAGKSETPVAKTESPAPLSPASTSCTSNPGSCGKCS